MNEHTECLNENVAMLKELGNRKCHSSQSSFIAKQTCVISGWVMSLTTPTLQIHIPMSASIQTTMLVNCIFFFIHINYRESLKFVFSVSRISASMIWIKTK